MPHCLLVSNSARIIATNFLPGFFAYHANSTLRIGFHENTFSRRRDHCRLPLIFVVAGLDAGADGDGDGSGHGRLARMHQQDYAGVRGPRPEQNACQGARFRFQLRTFSQGVDHVPRHAGVPVARRIRRITVRDRKATRHCAGCWTSLSRAVPVVSREACSQGSRRICGRGSLCRLSRLLARRDREDEGLAAKDKNGKGHCKYDFVS